MARASRHFIVLRVAMMALFPTSASSGEATDDYTGRRSLAGRTAMEACLQLTRMERALLRFTVLPVAMTALIPTPASCREPTAGSMERPLMAGRTAAEPCLQFQVRLRHPEKMSLIA